MAERPVVLFDVMDTLVVDPFRVHIPAFFGLSLAELLAQKHPTAWVDFEKGLIDEAAYAARMFADGRPVDPAALAAHVRQAYTWVDGARSCSGSCPARASRCTSSATTQFGIG